MVAININIADEDIVFFAERCAHWPRKETLILSDLHWGKSEALQTAGVPMPSHVLSRELRILESLVERTGAKRLLILGDLMHSAVPLPDEAIAQVATWRQSSPMSHLVIELIRGNHDRFFRLPSSWQIQEIVDGVREGPFNFTHAPPAKVSSDDLTWYGHIHPVIELRYGREFLRTPCFVVGKKGIMLPAFGLTTGGFSIKKNIGDRIFAVAGNEVLEV